jgi:hypothetical protein
LEYPSFDDRWMSFGWVLGVAVAGFAYQADGTGMSAFIGFIVGYGGPLMLCPVAEAVWRRSRSDYRALVAYRAALSAYQPIERDWQRKMQEWERTQLTWWCALHPRRFEQELGLLLRRRGLKVTWTGRVGDGGVDLRVDDGRGIALVQCKAHHKPIGPGPVRDVFGTLKHFRARDAWVVSLAGFTTGARRFAEGKPIRLLTIAEILREDPEAAEQALAADGAENRKRRG